MKKSNNIFRRLWHIVITEENKETLEKWLESERGHNAELEVGNIMSSYRFNFAGKRLYNISGRFSVEHFKKDYYELGEELTFEQFKKEILEEDKKPLFTSEEGVHIYKKDGLYIVFRTYEGELCVSSKIKAVYYKYNNIEKHEKIFHDEKLAEKYVFENNFNLTIQDMLSIEGIRENKSLVEKINKIAENNCAKKLLKEKEKSNFLIDFANPDIDFGNPILEWI